MEDSDLFDYDVTQRLLPDPTTSYYGPTTSHYGPSSSPTPPVTGRTVCCKVIMCIMSITQVAIGAVYLHDCPKQPYIPIYMIGTGVLPLLLIVPCILLCNNCVRKCTMALSCLLFLFILCWFIAGCVCIYSVFEPNCMDAHDFCNKTLYMFAIWTTNPFYLLLYCLLLFS